MGLLDYEIIVFILLGASFTHCQQTLNIISFIKIYCMCVICMMCYETLPVIQNQDKFSCFEGQLIIFSCLKVVQGTDLPGLLPPATVGVGWGVRCQGTSLSLQLLLLQGQLNSWEGWRFGWEEESTEKERGEVERREEGCQMSNNPLAYRIRR